MQPSLTTWIDVPEDSGFTIYNLPFGIFSAADKSPRPGVAIGEIVLDLKLLDESGLFDDLQIDPAVFSSETLNSFMALGRPVTNRVRARLQEELCDEASILKDFHHAIHPLNEVRMHLPVDIPNYTDFYSSEEHATNVGKLFRDPENALLPNWKHLPVAYHGRASSIITDGAPVVRPKGQIRPDDQLPPEFCPTRKLDFELELACIISSPNNLGEPVTVENAADHIFGFALFNDWSARDIQKWEYVPLGPFLGKSFASSMSPWIVPLAALQDHTVKGPRQEPPVLPYLEQSGACNFDIDLEVSLCAYGSDSSETICRVNASGLYWSIYQQIAHHTSNGCNLQTGDVLASGTISGKNPGSFGSMLELTEGGKKPFTLSSGEERSFLENGDRVTLTGMAGKGEHRVGFGSLTNTIHPSY